MSRKLLLVLGLTLALASCDDGDGDADGSVEIDSGPGTDSGAPDAGDPNCMEPAPDSGPGTPPPAMTAPPPTLDCGPESYPAGTSLWRHPYLESTTHTSVRIAWTSRSGGDGVVQWAPDPAGPWTDVPAAAEQFPTSRTDQEDDYVAYDATITGLTENSAYCYRIVEDGTVLAEGLRFDTAWTGTDRPVRIVAIGDSGDGSAEQLELRDTIVANEEFDILMHLGDMAYDIGRFTEFESYFFDVYADIMDDTAVFTTMGNHEFLSDSGQPYRDVYHIFEEGVREEDRELYYSFDYGNIHFVSLDSNEGTLIPIYLDINERVTDDMFDWMEQDLAASDAEWNVVFMHHPFYSSSERGVRWENIRRWLNRLEDLGVDLVLAGHDHHYERSVPTSHGCTSTMQDGLVQLVAGGSGKGLRDVTRGQWFADTTYNTDYSYLRMDFHGCELHGQAFNRAHERVDDFYLDGCGN